MSNNLVKEFPLLADPAMAEAVVAAVRDVFEPEAARDSDQDDNNNEAPSP